MPTQHNKIPIEGLLESYESALTKLGYSITSKLLFVKRAGLIIQRHQGAGVFQPGYRQPVYLRN